MPSIPYTDSDAIAARLGVTLSAAQSDEATLMAQAASDWIDGYLGRSWQATSPITNEIQTVLGDRVYLDHKPVVAVTAVETRSIAIGTQWTTLAAGQYELLDADAGILAVVGWGEYTVRVDYTHLALTPPSQIALAATMLAASWLGLGGSANYQAQGIKSYSTGGGELRVEYRDSGTSADAPGPVRMLLAGFKRVVVA